MSEPVVETPEDLQLELRVLRSRLGLCNTRIGRYQRDVGGGGWWAKVSGPKLEYRLRERDEILKLIDACERSLAS